MTDKEYLIKMIGLTDALSRLEPTDPDQKKAWDLAVSQIHLTNEAWERGHRWRHWHYWFKIAVLCAFLVFVVFSVVCCKCLL